MLKAIAEKATKVKTKISKSKQKLRHVTTVN